MKNKHRIFSRLSELKENSTGNFTRGFELLISNNRNDLMGGTATNNCDGQNCAAGCGKGQNVTPGCGTK
jgi:hypothetical protein